MDDELLRTLFGSDGHLRSFEAGSHHLYLHCEGERHGPAVVLDAGLYRDSTDWRLVQPKVAQFTQVCSYAREGLGKSQVDKGESSETECIDEQVEDYEIFSGRRTYHRHTSSWVTRAAEYEFEDSQVITQPKLWGWSLWIQRTKNRYGAFRPLIHHRCKDHPQTLKEHIAGAVCTYPARGSSGILTCP
jgi:hypothetical protein